MKEKGIEGRGRERNREAGREKGRDGMVYGERGMERERNRRGGERERGRVEIDSEKET